MVKSSLKKSVCWCGQFDKWVIQAYPDATKPMKQSIRARMRKHSGDPFKWTPTNEIESAWALVWEPFIKKATLERAAFREHHLSRASKLQTPTSAPAPTPRVKLPPSSEATSFEDRPALDNLGNNLEVIPATTSISRAERQPLPPRPSPAAIPAPSQPTQQQRPSITPHTRANVSAMAPIRLRGQQEPVFNFQHVSLLRLPI